MKKYPTLETTNLTLRPFDLADAPIVQRLAGEKEIASTTLNIPHPYEDGLAEQWISTHQGEFDKGEKVIFAITVREEGLIGAVGLVINQQHERAELGYWVGKRYWNKGYCTEAARVVIQYGFEVLGLNRIHATHLQRNPASGRVMQKIGMCYEGLRREHIKKWNIFEDIAEYGILRKEYEAQKAAS
ncbi:MAG: GNAT family N-acetyltransferase [Acidobacteriota bacterium]